MIMMVSLYDARIQSGGGGQGVWTPLPPLENHKAKGFLSNTGPDSLENHKASLVSTRNPVKNGHSQKDHKLVFKTNYCLMQVKILQNAPRGAFCNTFDLH